MGQKKNGLDLGSGGETRGRSSSPFRTILALLRNQEGHPHGPGDGDRKPHWGAFEYLWGVCLCEPTTKQNKHRPASRRCGSVRWSARSCAAMLGVKVEQVNAKLGHAAAGPCSLQLRVLLLGFLQDGNVGIGVLPEGEETLSVPSSGWRSGSGPQFPAYHS